MNNFRAFIRPQVDGCQPYHVKYETYDETPVAYTFHSVDGSKTVVMKEAIVSIQIDVPARDS